MLNVPIDECKQILADFDKEFPGVMQYSQKNEQKLRELGYVEDYMGRRRHLPHFNDKELVFKAYRKEYVNKDLFEKIFKFCCYHPDYFDTFNSLPKLAEELHYFDARTEEGWTYYFMGDY